MFSNSVFCATCIHRRDPIVGTTHAIVVHINSRCEQATADLAGSEGSHLPCDVAFLNGCCSMLTIIPYTWQLVPGYSSRNNPPHKHQDSHTLWLEHDGKKLFLEKIEIEFRSTIVE